MTEMNRIRRVLFNMSNRILGPYLAAINRTIISYVSKGGERREQENEGRGSKREGDAFVLCMFLLFVVHCKGGGLEQYSARSWKSATDTISYACFMMQGSSSPLKPSLSPSK
jgi:hypothetical protein